MTDLPPKAYTSLAGMRICRLVTGMWQMSGAHGTVDPDAALTNMFDYHASGFITWDLADHYGPAEELIGRFKTALEAKDEWEPVKAFTKWVPRPGPMTRQAVEVAVRRSQQRMQSPTLDMLQFHWWDYTDKRYMDALEHLNDLRQAGDITHLGLTNFDTPHLRTIHEAGIPIVSNQVQFSLVDMRPTVQMQTFCREHGIGLLTYGTLAGGLLSERYLNQPEPGRQQLPTASLRKYKGMIDAWGGWALFQELLTALKDIADRHGVTIANVATRAVLEQPAVAGVIIGARLGHSDRRAENTRAFAFQLEQNDWERITQVQAKAHDLYARIGGCGDEYRR
jgi:aryl-alcohol dehydrogenase-like predicted oxidoreductase